MATKVHYHCSLALNFWLRFFSQVVIVDSDRQTRFSHKLVLLVPLTRRVICLAVTLPSGSIKGLEASSANPGSVQERATYHCMCVEARRPLGGVSSPPLPFCRFLGFNLGQQACQE